MRLLSNYKNFKFELLLESLLLESKLVLSDKLIALLKNLKDSPIKNDLLKLASSNDDLTIAQNYFDIHDDKDKINFIQDKKAQEVVGDITYSVRDPNQSLPMIRDENDQYKFQEIYDKLGYVPTTMKYIRPGVGTEGKILSELQLDNSSEIYVLFEFEDSPKFYSIQNKASLNVIDSKEEKIWKLSKNPINVGRGIRSILTAAKIPFTDRELELFVNDYKSTFEINKDALGTFGKFDIIKGSAISDWYMYENYESQKGNLGKSCMKEVDSAYFELYCENPNVCSLVILYSDTGGSITDGKYKSNKIKGRALLWKTKIGMVLDRIYTINDSDVNLFIAFAEKNNLWHKQEQNSHTDFTAVRGNQNDTPWLVIDLDKAKFDYYPYLDTFCYLNTIDYTLSNKIRSYTNPEPETYELRDMDGRANRLDEEY